MPNTVEFPPQLVGTDAERIALLYNYLFKLSGTINFALQNIGSENLSVEYKNEIALNSASQSERIDDQYAAVKSIVIKTANIIRTEMDRMSADFSKTYAAKSEFGDYLESTKSLVEATANGIVQNYHLDSVLTTNDADFADFRNWKISSDQYIHSGLLYYDDENLPVYGVAVGNNLTYIEVDGKKIVKKENLAATFTAEKISFWQDGREAAYLSNQKLYILDAQVKGRLSAGTDDTIYDIIVRPNRHWSLIRRRAQRTTDTTETGGNVTATSLLTAADDGSGNIVLTSSTVVGTDDGSGNIVLT